MVISPIEAKFPLSFRREEAKELGEHIRLRHSVELIGAKRVGISDFLRFFLYRRGIVEKYIDKKQFHLFVAVDLNDLIEREVYPFWILTFKRLVDSVEKFEVGGQLKKEVNQLFLDCIQSQDLFLTRENIRKALMKMSEKEIFPTIFFIRFDRISDVVGSEFFANLEGLVGACAGRLSYIFTSFRKVDEIFAEALDRNFLHVFSNILFIKPLKSGDSKVAFNAFKKRYKISGKYFKELFKLSGGHLQLLHLAIVSLTSRNGDGKVKKDSLLGIVSSDERINLQSEEIWESLKEGEQAVLVKIHRGEKIKKTDKVEASYLWETGLVRDRDRSVEIFSPLFENFIKFKIGEVEQEEVVELTKKENLLYEFLLSNLDNICERDKIIEEVWPEEEELGVSDWTIDRLVSRLREKLKKKESGYQIVTVKTRGFKLAKLP